MNAVQLDVFGIKELNELFDGLKKGAKKSIMISAFRKASKPIIQTAKSNLTNNKSGNLKKSLGTKSHSYLPILKLGARIYGNYKGYVGHLINDGTDERQYKTKKGKIHRTGKLKGNHFWDRALASTGKAVEKSIQKEVFNSFEKYIIRYNRRAKTKLNK